MTDRAAWVQYRDAILDFAPQAGRRPEAWWAFEPRIPAELRFEEVATLDQFEALERARLAWLAGTDRLTVDEIEEIERDARQFADHPGFVSPAITIRDALRAAAILRGQPNE
ncbi:MAG: hypothetical protein M3473_06190 [Chloroflexota bacterium]|nr:hypothetical protein [Chloroflexota bacterium]